MPVPLVDHRLGVQLAYRRVWVELDRIRAQAHGPTHVGDLLLLREQVDHREWSLRVELGGVGALHARHVPRELGYGDLHTQADTEVGHPALAGDLGGPDLALDPTAAEA